MDVRDDTATQPAIDRFEPLDPRKLWVLGLAVEPDGSVAGPGLRRFSFWADCECPGDCTRDHENE
jgi:hypothetical protein